MSDVRSENQRPRECGSVYDYLTRVYYHDTDAGGVVYHGSYAAFAERARCEWLRHLGFRVAELKKKLNLLLVVKKLTMEFHHAARLDEVLLVRCDILHIGKASLLMRQDIYRYDESGGCAGLQLTSMRPLLVGVCESAAGVFKACALPPALVEALRVYAVECAGDGL